MVEVEFNYQQNKIIIQGNLTDSFETVTKKYADKANLDINNIYFISGGRVINKEDKLEEEMSDQTRGIKK